MRKRPLRAGGCTAATAIRRACRPRALRVCGSTTARQARAAQSDAAASKSSRASSAAATDGDPLVRVPADAFVPSNRRAWALRTCSTWAATAAVDMVAPQVGERGDERWWFQRALVSVFVKPVPPPSSKQGTRLDLKEFAANQNISDPPLAGSPTCAVKHKMPHAARGRLNECRAQHAHVVQHTHSTHTRAECARDEYTALRPSDPSARRPREALDNSLRGG